MSKTIKAFVAVSLVAFVAACAQQQEEETMVAEEEVTEETVYTGKYK